MRVLSDTNVLISAALNANGIPFQAYVKAVSYPNHGLICEQKVDEMIYHGTEGPGYEESNKARYWFNKAAKKGDENAKKMLFYYL